LNLSLKKKPKLYRIFDNSKVLKILAVKLLPGNLKCSIRSKTNNNGKRQNFYWLKWLEWLIGGISVNFYFVFFAG
jgi:hypothetical protein